MIDSVNYLNIDLLFELAVKTVSTFDLFCSSDLQIKMEIEYDYTEKLIKQLELTGIIKKREYKNEFEVVIKSEDELNWLLDNCLKVSHIGILPDSIIKFLCKSARSSIISKT
jgi:hypothetical protein